MPVPLCRHIKTSGNPCRSPALLGHRFCYFHNRLASRHRNYRPNERLDPFFEPGRHIRLNAIEDRASVQMALSQTVNALATGQIELKHARAILYGLQLAGQMIKESEARPELATKPEDAVTNIVYSNDYLDLLPAEPILEPATLEGDALQALGEPTPFETLPGFTTYPVPHPRTDPAEPGTPTP